MDGNVSWKPEMTRVILDCVDQAAGDNSIFVTNKDAAIQQVLTNLRPVTDPKTYGLLNATKIFNKIAKQATLGGCPSLSEVLQQGTQRLDLSKLQKGTYSEKEIQEAKKGQQKKLKHSSMTKNQGAGKAAASSSNQDTSKATKMNDETEKAEHPSKKIKLSHPTALSADRDDSQAVEIRKRRAADTAAHAENTETCDLKSSDHEGHRSTRDLQEETIPNLNARFQMTVIFVCEVCDKDFQSRDLLLSHKSSHEPSALTKNTIRSSPEAANAYRKVNVTSQELAILELARSAWNGGNLDAAIVSSQMVDIQARIFEATDSFLSSSEIDGSASILLRTQSYEDSLSQLLRSIFRSGLVDRHTQFTTTSSPPEWQMGRREILLSTIGCAITNWALTPLPQGEVLDGVLGEMNKLLHDRSPAFQYTATKIATRQYLEKHVKPLVHGFAQVFAQDIFHLLRHFLPDRWQSSQPRWLSELKEKSQADTVSENDPSRAQLPASELPSPALPQISTRDTEGSFKWPPKTQKHPTRIFLNDLQEAFEVALNLRLDMEIKGNMLWSFNFPLSGIALDLKEHVVHNRLNNKKISYADLEVQDVSTDQGRKRKILVGLTPTIYGTFKNGDGVAGGEENSIVISRGCVHIRTAQD